VSGVDVAALRALAEAATPGPWVSFSGYVWRGEWDSGDCVAEGVSDGNAAFTAAANPTEILALLDEVERLRATLARVGALADEWWNDHANGSVGRLRDYHAAEYGDVYAADLRATLEGPR
jgi:hypothetical protein